MKKLALLLLLASVLGVVGIFSGWFFRGFTPAELEQLDRDWEQVIAWADLPAADPVMEARMNTLSEETGAAGLPDDLFSRAEGAWVSREELTPEAAELLSRFEEQLAEGALGGIPPGMQVLGFMKLGQLELNMEDLTSERLGNVLVWSRKLQLEGSLIGLMMGVALGEQALERCRLEPALLPASVAASAPSVDEFFYGLCRDYVVAEMTVTIGSSDVVNIPGTGGDEFATQALRRAMANNAQRFYPQRSDPLGFAERPAVEMPDTMDLWLAGTFGSAETYSNYMESFFSSTTAQRTWIEFVESWDEVLGA